MQFIFILWLVDGAASFDVDVAKSRAPCFSVDSSDKCNPDG